MILGYMRSEVGYESMIGQSASVAGL